MMIMRTSFVVCLALLVAVSHAYRATAKNPSGRAADSVLFAADNTATLYVNGKRLLTTRSWPRFARVALKDLKDGDVVAFTARDYGGYYGMIAIINTHLEAEAIVSGVGDSMYAVNAKHLPAKDRANWHRRSYSGVCGVGSKWSPAKVRSASPNWVPGQARNLPVTAARYVWAEGAGERDTICARIKIGGEGCDWTLATSKASISYTADDTVSLYVNGILVGRNLNWRKVGSASVTLKNGDVIAMSARDTGGGYGAIAAVAFDNGNALVTGGVNNKGFLSEWRGSQHFRIDGDANGWAYPSYNDCNWKPVFVQDIRRTGAARHFPRARTGAQYVWATGVPGNRTVFLRAVVGGRVC